MDVKANSSGYFQADTVNNIANVSTPVGLGFRRTTTAVTRGNFSVTFSRPFITGDTANDTIIRNDDFDIIWSAGQIQGGFPAQHLF